MLPAPNKDLSGSNVYLGLGFDSISNDYKLLRIGFRYNPGVQAELYSSKADSWKEIQIPKTIKTAKRGIPNIVHAKPGILYMTLRSSYDILEVFRLQPIPDIAMSDILDFEGNVAMVFKSGEGSTLGLFVLNDICGEVPWTKLFNLEGDVKISRVVCYLGAGEFVIKRADDAVGTYTYNYKTRETKKYALDLTTCTKSAVNTYTESLVSLNGFKQQDESSK
ncbi:hypothetical protein POM88_023443 [Heracleum sosnowskyi]|uniref:F-box protein n=1 Tax=Heracleum sosnowskyi TaxID=360622 RepID=A0AAD8IJH0_9APIA|nr:hypothetical protein POM88_023443 [Heracleum sosnowskyi]